MGRTVWTLVATVLLSLELSSGEPSLQASGEWAAQIDSLNQQAFRAFQSRDFRTAKTAARQAWALCGTDADGCDAGLAAANLAGVLTMYGRFEEALQWQDRAEEIFEREGNSTLQGRLAVARAVTRFLAEEEVTDSIARARELLGEDDWRLGYLEAGVQSHSSDAHRVQAGYAGLLKACRASGDSAGVVLCAMHLGQVEGSTGGHRAALAYYTRALEILRSERDSSRIGLALRNIGLAHRKLRQYSESEAASQEAVGLARTQGDRRLVVEVLNDLSMLYVEMGEDARARDRDMETEKALRSIAEDLKRGRLTDTVLLDFYQLLNMRYLNRTSYDTDLFVGFYDQLMLRR